MLILVGVTVTVAINGGLFEKTRQGTYDYKVETIKENLTSYEVDYYLETQHEIKDEVKEAIAKISIETGIDANKFIVWHDEIAIKKNSEDSETSYPEIYIFYDWNKASLDDIKYLEEMTEDKKKEIDAKIDNYNSEGDRKNNIYLLYNRCFIYDFNGDGYLNRNDYGGLNTYVIETSPKNYYVTGEKLTYYKELLGYIGERVRWAQVGDLNGSLRVDATDGGFMDERLNGETEMSFYEEQIDADKNYPYYVRTTE